MTDLERQIQAIEHGLLNASRSTEHPTKKMELIQRMAYYKVPGISLALIDQEHLAWAKGYGLMEAGSDRPITSETIFQAASISKPVIGMVALHLVEAGLLDLDADANDFLRSWKIPASKYLRVRPDGTRPLVTLRGLLSHTSGMGSHGYQGYPAGSSLPNLLQILDGQPLANSKPVRMAQEPGKGFLYSGGGYLVIQQMMEDVTGIPLAVLAKAILFDKLGMTHSTFDSTPPQDFTSQAASAHLKTGEPLPGKWHTYPEQAAASMWTTPSDLACLIVEVLKSLKSESNRVLSAEMTRRMLVPQISMGRLGFNIVIQDGLTRFGHPGWNEGIHNMMIACPETGQGIIWMTNGENGRQLGREVSRGLAEIVKYSWW